VFVGHSLGGIVIKEVSDILQKLLLSFQLLTNIILCVGAGQVI
jgi:surfactin synthase thioesterase subunit